VHQELSATVTHSQTSTANIANVASLADALYEARSATYRLVMRSHMYHWNVTGSHFLTVHGRTETQYTDMFAAADVIAERIRALGKSAVIDFAQVSGGVAKPMCPNLPKRCCVIYCQIMSALQHRGAIQLERLNLPKLSGCRSRHHAGGFP
jgi:hypothetical protein